MAKISKSELPEIPPTISVDHTKYEFRIEIKLPGVKKEDIELEMGEQSFCLRAPAKDHVYSACYTLAHNIDTDKVEAKFERGLLTILAPFKTPIGGTKIPIK